MKLTDSQMLEIFDREVRQSCEWTRMRREVLPNVVRYIEEGSDPGGFVSWSHLTAENAEWEIERQVEFFGSMGAEFEWKLYSHDTPADLGARLKARGFIPGKPEALMVADVHELAHDLQALDTAVVRRVTSPAEVDAIIVMENEVWGSDLSRIGEGLKHDLLKFPHLLSIYAVWDGGRVVSAAWTWFLEPTSFAGLWGGSTLKDYRGRGYYRALLAARAREARERGFRFLQVDASPDSQPILAKNGFRCLGYSTSYEWKAGKS